MKNIDFLPSDYRERSARRRGGAWRLAAALALLVVVAGIDVRVRIARYSAEQELIATQQPFLAAQQAKARLAGLEAELAAAEEHASLLAYLSHRWPLTQLLAVPSIDPPPAIRLTQVRMERRVGEGSSPRAQRGGGGDFQLPTAETATRSPMALAFDELRKMSPQEMLAISGTTSDTEAVQRYVTSLSRSPLVKSANLHGITKGTAAPAVDGGQAESQFVVHVTIVDSLQTALEHKATTADRGSRLEKQEPRLK